MNNSLRLITRGAYRSIPRISSMRCYSSSGNDSGRSGAIREAGGAFGKREAAKEDEYFYRQQKEQIAKLKDTIAEEIQYHEDQIKIHRESIERIKKKINDMPKE